MTIFLRNIFFLLSVGILVHSCPPDCACHGTEVECSLSSEMDALTLVNELLKHPFNETTHFQLISAQNFSLNSLSEMRALRSLKIYNSTLQENENFLVNMFPELEIFHCIECGLTTFPGKILLLFSSLTELDISFNKLKNFGADSIHSRKIKKIAIRNNKIMNIGVHAFRYMPSLEVLDLCGNNLSRLVTSDFISAVSLRELNLCNNRIKLIETDTTSTFQQLEYLHLDRNLLREFPLEAQQNFKNLFLLNISYNVFESISEGFLQLPDLQVLSLINSSVTVVGAGSLIHLPRLHSLDLRDNPKLRYFSPFAFSNNTSLYQMNIQNTGFRRIPLTILERVSQLHIARTDLECSCIVEDMHDFGAVSIIDWHSATCRTKHGAIKKLSHLVGENDSCRDGLLTPFGIEQTAVLGSSYRIYCANDGRNVTTISWVPMNESMILAGKPEYTKFMEKKTDYFTTTLLDPSFSKRRTDRIHVSTEYYGFDVILERDAGFYTCLSNDGQKTISRKIQLHVSKPRINLETSSIAPTSIHLSWNENLEIRAVDRVALRITASNKKLFRRQVQLSLYNVFRSYNLVNLTPDEEYQICLEWHFIETDEVIYNSCITEKTGNLKSYFHSWTPEFLFVLITIVLICFIYCCGHRAFYAIRIKKRAKMQQSVSGQSFISQSSTDATTYENYRLSDYTVEIPFISMN